MPTAVAPGLLPRFRVVEYFDALQRRLEGERAAVTAFAHPKWGIRLRRNPLARSTLDTTR